MKIVIQRVKKSAVIVSGEVVGQIGQGILILLAIAKDDGFDDIEYLVSKLIDLRIFEDSEGKMNASIVDVKGKFLVVSQFTLLADCKKGRRPSFDKAADPKKAEELYEAFVEALRKKGCKVETGVFRAMMDVSLINDGPVTFVLDSK
ncbi:MAG: D-aminoacyl-tRNA deacylase [Candidatus Aceula lacicola]|nr:D-aminoacyl-tRNA deacylase [Candidatus Aceula lacicola]